jgi:hypothetical protein
VRRVKRRRGRAIGSSKRNDEKLSLGLAKALARAILDALQACFRTNSSGELGNHQ